MRDTDKPKGVAKLRGEWRRKPDGGWVLFCAGMMPKHERAEYVVEVDGREVRARLKPPGANLYVVVVDEEDGTRREIATHTGPWVGGTEFVPVRGEEPRGA